MPRVKARGILFADIPIPNPRPPGILPAWDILGAQFPGPTDPKSFNPSCVFLRVLPWVFQTGFPVMSEMNERVYTPGPPARVS